MFLKTINYKPFQCNLSFQTATLDILSVLFCFYFYFFAVSGNERLPIIIFPFPR